MRINEILDLREHETAFNDPVSATGISVAPGAGSPSNSSSQYPPPLFPDPAAEQVPQLNTVMGFPDAAHAPMPLQRPSCLPHVIDQPPPT
jgi:hypothetical protein